MYIANVAYLFRSFILRWSWQMLNKKTCQSVSVAASAVVHIAHTPLVTVKLASKANSAFFPFITKRSCCTRHEVTELASKLTLLVWKSMRRILQASYRPHTRFGSVFRFPRRNFASGATLPSFLRMGLHYSATRHSRKVCQFFRRNRRNAFWCIHHWKLSFFLSF